MSELWLPSLGCCPEADGYRFRVWAPELPFVNLSLGTAYSIYPMEKESDGTWTVHVSGCRAGTVYRFVASDKGAFPDPASRFQPQGVHGPSQIVNPWSFDWTDADWNGLPLEELVFYELHVGTFTPVGTFDALRQKLPYLKRLGVNAIELMPLGDFPGERNWGYDGVSLFAPARCYGKPDDLRQLVDEAHRLKLAIFVDVVYNHLGPDGNYTGVYSPYYLSKKHRTPWGDAINFDGSHSEHVRNFFIENALHWLLEYHVDGLRLDATHAIVDDGSRHFLAELSERVAEGVPGRQVHLIAEDHRNLAHMVKPHHEGWGLDGIWADDLHHQMRRLLAGDSEGYYRDYSGTTTDIATTINQGWFFTGQHSEHLDEPRGSDPAGLPHSAFVVCLQNHDQIGNRAFGERLHHQISPEAYRAATVLLLCSPMTPLLFMGQEWACSTPFRFFTDHNPQLGRLVTEGRRREFKHFAAFSDPQSRELIPDPQERATFEVCKLDWNEQGRPSHSGIWQLHQELLRLRRTEPALLNIEAGSFKAWAAGADAVILERRASDGRRLLILCQLRGSGFITDPLLPAERGEIVLSTEEPRFTTEPQPFDSKLVSNQRVIEFKRPGAVILGC